jgi:hypothetical protein
VNIAAQRWYFDNANGLPNRVDFMLPAAIGPMEAFPGTVMLSNYRAVSGVLYPFKIVTFLQRQRATQTITLQSVTPSTAVPSTTTAATLPGGSL